MRLNSLVVAVVGLISVVGCGQTGFEDALPATIEEVDEIRTDESLAAQEKREELALLLDLDDADDPSSVDAVILNGLLQDERLANQFGGDLSSAYDKVAGDQLAELTADEVQYYGDATDQVTLTDAEAQGIVDLFNDENIDSLAELEDFLDDPATELPTEVDETNLRAVFIETTLDYVRDKL